MFIIGKFYSDIDLFTKSSVLESDFKIIENNEDEEFSKKYEEWASQYEVTPGKIGEFAKENMENPEDSGEIIFYND